MSTKHDIIRFRRGTSAEWAASLPQPGGEVLKLGEPGWEKDTGKLKIGDGSTPWNSLPYLQAENNQDVVLTEEDVEQALVGILVDGRNIKLTHDNPNNSVTVSFDTDTSTDNNLLVYNQSVDKWEPSTNLTFDGYRMVIDCTCPSGLAGYTMVGEERSTLFSSRVYSNTISTPDPDDPIRPTARAVFLTARGTEASPSGCGVGDNMFIIRGDAYNPHGTLTESGELDSRTFRMRSDVVDTGTHYLASNFVVNTSSGGPTLYDNELVFTKDGVLKVNDITVSLSGHTHDEFSVFADTLEPDGFINRTDSEIAFDNGSREFSISPKAPATSYGIYNNGVKVTKTTTETIGLPNSTALYYIYFDKSDNSLSYKTTGFDFNTDIPIAQVYYNTDDGKIVYFGEERHGIRMDAATHKYLHNVFGTQYINGLSISNYTLTGNGSSNSDVSIAIGNGLIYDEDIEANITHSDTPSNPFEQVLHPIAQIPVYYRNGATGAWTDTIANDYPVKTGTTIQYNLDTAGIWSAANSTNPNNNRYIAYWICATTQENAPIISIMGQRIDSSIEQATSNNAWSSLNLTGLPIVELRPLYRLIYDTKSTFTNTPKGFLADVLDIRSHVDTVTGLTQNDHGNLYGLADDDHYQYVHIDNARTIDAVHTFSNGITFGDSTTQTTAWNGISSDTGFIPTYPIRAYIFGGQIVLYNTVGNTYNTALPITYYWGLANGDIKEYSITEYPNTSFTVDCIDSINKALVDYPGTYVQYSSLEVALLDSDNRIVGWATSATSPVPMPTHGSVGYSLTMNLFDFPNWSGIPTTWNLTSLNSESTTFKNLASTLFNRPVAYDIVDSLPLVSVLDKGSVSGSSVSIDGNKNIQTMTMNGTAVTLNKGNNWYGSKEYSRDVVLKITVSSPTSITWNIINEWYNQPPAGALGVGTHQFLLRLINQTTIEGHYIGVRTLPSP